MSFLGEEELIRIVREEKKRRRNWEDKLRETEREGDKKVTRVKVGSAQERERTA